MKPEEYACMRAVEDNHWWYRALHRLVLDACARYAPEKAHIVDVGCGTGGMAAHLMENHRVTGLDIAPEAVVFCQQRGMGRLVRADAGRLPVDDGVADVVLLLDVLYHSQVPDRAGVLAEARRIAKPGGIIIINVPAYQWLYSSHDVAVHTAHRFTRGEINRLVKGADLEIATSTYWNSLLLPAIVACRMVFRFLPDRGSDLDPDTPAWINNTLGALMALERSWMNVSNLPAGVSIFIVGRVPTG